MDQIASLGQRVSFERVREQTRRSRARVRRRLITLAILVAGCVFAAQRAALAEDHHVRVMMFAATWEKWIKPLAEDFQKQTGITIDVVIENTSVEGLAKLEAMRSNPEVDVWFTGEALAARAASDKNLFVPLPKDKMPNYANLIDGAGGNDTFAPIWYFPLGIAYRPDLVPGGKIDSWADLWEPAFRNRVALPGPPIYPGRTILLASLLNGGSIDNIQPGLDFLKRVNDNIAMYFAAEPQTRRALAQGEIWAMMTSPTIIRVLGDQNIPIAMVSPKPTPLIFEGMMIVNAGHVDAAAAFINAALSPTWQSRMTDAYNMGPINRTVEPSPAFAKAMPKKGDGVVFDESLINARLGDWTERFNASVAK